jgi:transcription elongation factor GreB
MSKAFTKEDQENQEEDLPEETISGTGPRHITPEGFKRLQNEVEQLWRVERPRVTAMVSAAAAEGDRSENAEYIYGKKRLREIDGRIRFLSKLLDRLTIVEQRAPCDQIFFGAWVTLEDEDKKEVTYRIVGPDESDSRSGLISCESPVAKALLGKREGDWASVIRPKGPADFLIIKVRY